MKLKKIYSTAKVGGLDLEPNLTRILAETRDPDMLLATWWGWHEATGPPMKDLYEEFISLLNTGATDNGNAWS